MPTFADCTVISGFVPVVKLRTASVMHQSVAWLSNIYKQLVSL